MRNYNVIIVGAGPAGLRCAEILSQSDLTVLLLEKNPVVGDKICAGGITRKGFQLMDIPDEIIEQKVDEIKMHSGKYHNHKHLPEPLMYMVDRKAFGNWQLKKLKGTSVEVRLKTKVTRINEKSVIINDDEELGFDYLVGGDGVNSLVRKHLKLPLDKTLVTIQYIIPTQNQSSYLEIFLSAKHFHSWYGWSFPHQNTVAVGACCDPRYVSGKQFKTNVHHWLSETGFDISEAKHESYPISYDYRGLQFGNVFLTGEAAGLASGLTGEGIFQSLVSGEEVANRILNRNDSADNFNFILKYNDIQHMFLRFLLRAGPLRYLVPDLIILLMKNGWVSQKIRKGFS